MNLELLGALTLITVLGIIGISYPHYGRTNGWPVGRFFGRVLEGRPTLAEASVLCVPLAFFVGWYRFGILVAGGVVVAGFVIAWVLTEVLRQHVQAFWMFGFVAFFVGTIWSRWDRLF